MDFNIFRILFQSFFY